MRDRRGVASLEFGLCGLAALMLLLLVFEGCWQFFVGATLDRVTREAGRFGATGNPYPSSLPASTTAGKTPRGPAVMADFAQALSGGVLLPSRLTVTIESAASAAQLGTGAARSGAGAGGETARYTFSYRQPVLTPFLATALGSDVVTHVARTVIRNEPFPPS